MAVQCTGSIAPGPGRIRDFRHRLVGTGAYRALPSRRVAIPKPDGGTRPLGIAALEDKIVQKAVVDVILTPIYEPEFLGFSYGFRPGRGAHDALDALAFGIDRRKVGWIVDADIRAFLRSTGSRETICCGFSSTESGTNGYSG